MTNSYSPPPFTPAPPDGYWYLHTNHATQGKLTRAAYKRVSDEFTRAVELGVELLAKKETDPEKLRMGYWNKPITLWVGQRVYFPQRFEKSWADWERVDPSPEARRLRDATMAEVSAQAEALQRQLALQEAQSRAPAPLPAMAGGPEVPPAANPGPPPPEPAVTPAAAPTI